jgi:hypothetical protein
LALELLTVCTGTFCDGRSGTNGSTVSIDCTAVVVGLAFPAVRDGSALVGALSELLTGGDSGRCRSADDGETSGVVRLVVCPLSSVADSVLGELVGVTTPWATPPELCWALAGIAGFVGPGVPTATGIDGAISSGLETAGPVGGTMLGDVADGEGAAAPVPGAVLSGWVGVTIAPDGTATGSGVGAVDPTADGKGETTEGGAFTIGGVSPVASADGNGVAIPGSCAGAVMTARAITSPRAGMIGARASVRMGTGGVSKSVRFSKPLTGGGMA